MYHFFIRESLRHLWWDVLIAGDPSWMDKNNGYMFVALYLSFVSVIVSSLALRHA